MCIKKTKQNKKSTSQFLSKFWRKYLQKNHSVEGIGDTSQANLYFLQMKE